MGDVLTYNEEILTYNGDKLVWKDIEMPFQFTIDTNNIVGTTYTLGLSPSGTYDATVDWGDDTTTTITSDTDTGKSHTYTENGIYTIKILGECTILVLNDSSIRNALISIDSWGNTNQFTFVSFENCINLTEFPNFGNALKNVTSLQFSFSNCNSLTNIDISNSDLSSATTLFNAFSQCSNLETFNAEGVDLSSCNNARTLLENCNSLKNANISNITLNTNINFTRAFNQCTSLKTVNTSNTFSNGRLINSSFMFVNTSIEEVDFSDWDVSNVTTIVNMFQNCSNLETVDISNWDLVNATSVSTFFFNCINLITVNGYEDMFINNTKNISLSNFWSNCRKIKTIDVSKWLFKVTNLTNTFNRCELLEEIIGINSLDVSLATITSGCFRSIKSISSLDLSNWDVSNLQNTSNMFRSTDLQTINISNWDLSSLTNTGEMFRDSFLLSNIIGINNSTIKNVTNIRATFYNCQSLTSLDLSNWDVSNVDTMNIDLSTALAIFENASGLTELNISGWGNHKTSNFRAIFNGCESLETIIGIEDFITSGVTRSDFIFRNCKSLPWIDGSNWDTTNITNPQGFFQNCESLSGITNIENLNWSNADNFNRFFNNCQKLPSLDLSDWDISSSTDLREMFSNCEELTELNLSGWTFDNKLISTSFGDGIFYNCIKLNNIIGLEYITISGVENLNSVFRNCESLSSLDLSHWDTTSVTNMGNTFFDCTGLTELNLSGWTFESINSINNLNNFLRSVTLNTSDYDDILINLSTQDLLNNVTFNGGNSKYSTTGQTARNFIISEFNWSFNDGGLET